MSSLWKQFLDAMIHQKTLAKKHQFFLAVPGLRSQHFRHLLQKLKLKMMASWSSNHLLDLYLPKSLGPYTFKIYHLLCQQKKTPERFKLSIANNFSCVNGLY